MRSEADYIKLIRRIGIPSIIEGDNTNYDNNSTNMYNLARLNKILMLYVTINKRRDYILEKRYANIVNILRDIVNLLNDNNLDYVIFKTLKPFPYIPSDIDMLIDPTYADRVTRLLINNGYYSFIKDSFCTTIKKNYINIDLYSEPSVSDIPYLSRISLVRYPTITNIEDIAVKRLNNNSEFIAVMCHSFYKEQMFTISDYYTLTILAENSNINEIIALSEENNCLDILYLVSNICKYITLEVFNINDLAVCTIADILTNKNDINKIITSRITTLPYKFPITHVVVSLFKKVTKEQGNVRAIRYFTNNISFRQMKKLIGHIKRDTY